MRFGAVLALTTLVAGCAGAPSHQRPAPRPVVGYPFAGAVQFSDAEQAAVTAAEDVLVARCMRDRGFGYLPRTRSEHTPSAPANPYGLLAPDEARIHGYRMAEAALAERPTPDPNEAARARMPEDRRSAWDSALLGTTARQREIRIGDQVFTYRPDGCTYLARQQLFGAGWDRLFLTVQVASNAVIDTVRRSSRFTAAQRQWSVCMRERDHQVDTFGDARRTVADALAKARTDQRAAAGALRLEQRIAIDDAACQQDSGVWAAVAATQQEAERARPADTVAAVRRLRLDRAAAVERAQATIR